MSTIGEILLQKIDDLTIIRPMLPLDSEQLAKNVVAASIAWGTYALILPEEDIPEHIKRTTLFDLSGSRDRNGVRFYNDGMAFVMGIPNDGEEYRDALCGGMVIPLRKVIDVDVVKRIVSHTAGGDGCVEERGPIDILKEVPAPLAMLWYCHHYDGACNKCPISDLFKKNVSDKYFSHTLDYIGSCACGNILYAERDVILGRASLGHEKTLKILEDAINFFR